MTVFGITGGTGAGKTTALSVLEEFGACIIDCDAVYHELLRTSPALLSEIKAAFPGSVINGVLDRKTLGTVVFDNEEKLRQLNRITHGYVTAEVEDRLSAARESGRAVAAIDAIGLLESGLDTLCDITVAVTAALELRAARITARDHLEPSYSQLRIQAQKPDSYFAENCDFVLVNDCQSAEAFKRKCRKFFEQRIGGDR